MPFAEDAFSTLGETVVIDGRSIRSEHLRDADLLAVRSTTRLNRHLLDGSRVRFVGTATIGTDHLDIPWLESRGIRWCHAPGCNANSVSEYVATALLCLAGRHRFSLRGKTLGVIGVGQVGHRVAAKGRTLGMRVVLNDPPQADELRAGHESRWGHLLDEFISLDALLEIADIVTLHVPLTHTGDCPTHHMASASFFAKLKPGAIFVNCARGATVDTPALLSAIRSGQIAYAVIDTWEGEPLVSTDLASCCAIATPHIAGHSFEGRAMGTVMVYEEACRFLEVDPRWHIDQHWPAPPVPVVDMKRQDRGLETLIRDAVSQVYNIEADDHRFRASLHATAEERSKAFDRLRREYPLRREFRFTEVQLPAEAPAALRTTLETLGFRCVERADAAVGCRRTNSTST